MKKTENLVYSLAFYILKFISVVFSAFLFIGALLFSSSDTDITTLKTFVTPDNIFPCIIGIAVFLSIILFFRIPYKNNPILTIRLLLIVTLSVYAIVGTLLIIFTKSAPFTDPQFVYEIVQNCAQNNFTDIDKNSYLSVYPHQIGLVFFYEPLLRLWNLLGINADAYVFFQFINLLLTLVLIYFLYKLTDKFFSDSFVCACFLLLSIGFLPLYFYILRVYGDLPSLTFFVMGLWAFTEIISPKSVPLRTSGSIRKQRISKFFLYLFNIVCFILCVATRKNSIIGLIALIIITFCVILHQKRWTLFLLICSYLLIAFFTLPAIQTFYETRAENKLDDGTPPIAYIAMGMQNAPKACGWYNGFNYSVYVEPGYDLEFANFCSKIRINERLDYFKANPGNAFDFYFEKYASQWCDGSYASRELTAYTTLKRPAFVDSFYGKNGGKLFLFFCNIYQSLLYFGVLLFSLRSYFDKKEKNLLPYTVILMAFGGFLFHFLWEANARAIFTYSLLLLPVSGAGIATICNILRSGLSKVHFRKIL